MFLADFSTFKVNNAYRKNASHLFSILYVKLNQPLVGSSFFIWHLAWDWYQTFGEKMLFSRMSRYSFSNSCSDLSMNL